MKTRLNRLAFLLAIAAIAFTGIQAKSSSKLFVPEFEPEMEIESWMTADVYWSNCDDLIEQEAEPELELETWMVDEGYWR
ncbi:hypothetical protein [Gaoshiqia sediminis]|uniref:Uncharacterized protein n=1 Tax=Gaoshiqia sediminis TaxID=2986998 RepID=A0AA42C7A5_9BACT|nr:hypothetical protein [Gaoshiqia sediminis]MCW0484788.1 hypothetical protein [Gaoshiqia sediminis]